jgi:2-oxo-3-hexenedioate decarboxylase
MTDHLNSAHDDRLDPGMRAQVALLRDAESGGAAQAGWKAGFGTSAWREKFGLAAPLVGYLLDTTRIDPDAHVAVGSWTAPRGEAEIAMRLGRDVSGDATPEQALAAVDAIAPAIELVDLDPAPVDPSQVLSGNIYHRCWVTGPFDTARAGGDLSGLIGRVTIMGDDMGTVTDVESSTGPAGEILAEVARIAQRHGRGLRSGDIVILGSIVPPTAIAPGGTFHYVLGDAPALEVTLTD